MTYWCCYIVNFQLSGARTAPMSQNQSQPLALAALKNLIKQVTVKICIVARIYYLSTGSRSPSVLTENFQQQVAYPKSAEEHMWFHSMGIHTLALAHWRVIRWAPKAALEQVSSSHSHLLSLDHHLHTIRLAMCIPTAMGAPRLANTSDQILIGCIWPAPCLF